ncbi:MAG: response regulator transcription factor [Actinomycetota bacterium]|nr:response regulator transcription factor [Actinomycetota bacterium]
MRSVLIVDDGATDREMLGTILVSAGHTVFKVESGDHALQLAREHKPALIIADILIPTMDGYELVRELRGNEPTAHIPVIFYTASYVLEEVRDLAAACGVSQILIKPCGPEEVLRVVNETLSKRPDPVPPLPSEDFHRKHLRLLNAKLLQKVDELRETVILAGALQRESEATTEGTHSPTISSDSRFDALSPRELQILGMIVEGATNGEIAERLVIATSTVQSHVKRILHKLDVKNRTEAAVRYMRK